MTDEERKARNRENSRRYRLRHPDRVKAYTKRHYWAMKLDPDKYAMSLAVRNAWRTAHKDEINRKQREYIRCHKRKMKRKWRFERDKMRMWFRESPELYASFRRYHRNYKRMWWRRRNPLARRYIPKNSIRIPDTCCFGRVLDTRSVFLWNNLPAASLVAGRAYRAMQWREIHCDRFGQVCR